MDKPQEIEFAHLLFGGITIFVLLALSIVIFVVLYQRKLQLQQAHLHHLDLTYQRTILEAVVNSQESERERMAQDLHDEVGASLSVAKLFVNQIRYETSPDEMKLLADQSSQILATLVQDVRQIAHNLSPLLFENLGLKEAIKTVLNRFEAVGLIIHYLDELPSESLSMQQQLLLYRIIQEGLGNVLKHAEATQLSLQLKQEGQRVWLRIEDNGKGFDDQQINLKRPGMGMNTLKARAGVLGAELKISSVIGQGTCLEMSMPI